MSASLEEHRRYWDQFYASTRSSDVPSEPSAFAVWVADRIAADRWVAEFGFGTARDSLWFVRQGHPLRGFDFADSAVARANGHVEDFPGQAAFAALDLADDVAVKAVTAELQALPSKPALYGRFLIHSLEDHARHNLLAIGRDVATELFVEFRTGKDAEGEHLFGDDHFRTYLDPETVVAEIEERGGRVTTLDQGYGMAVYKTEDPHCARIVADWS